MSYCVNCGVELNKDLNGCPLCNTPVINPNEIAETHKKASAFPEEKGNVEVVKRKDLAVLLSAVVVATSVTCGLLNLWVFNSTPWSFVIIGACAIIWVIMLPVVIYTKLPIYISLLADGAITAGYLYLLTYMTSGKEWFWGIGLPIVILATVILELFTFSVRRLPRAFLTIALYCFIAIGAFCIGLEIIIDRHLYDDVTIQWSGVVLTICGIVIITIITLLSRRRLRNAVRRRLHF